MACSNCRPLFRKRKVIPALRKEERVGGLFFLRTYQDDLNNVSIYFFPIRFAISQIGQIRAFLYYTFVPVLLDLFWGKSQFEQNAFGMFTEQGRT